MYKTDKIKFCNQESISIVFYTKINTKIVFFKSPTRDYKFNVLSDILQTTVSNALYSTEKFHFSLKSYCLKFYRAVGKNTSLPGAM